jgi:hypothetical protein
MADIWKEVDDEEQGREEGIGGGGHIEKGPFEELTRGVAVAASMVLSLCANDEMPVHPNSPSRLFARALALREMSRLLRLRSLWHEWVGPFKSFFLFLFSFLLYVVRTIVLEGRDCATPHLRLCFAFFCFFFFFL